jgi:nucleoside-diphosphate-sugar epimerase
MKTLFIGGTGNISASVSRLAVARGIDLYLLNRGQTKKKVDGVKVLRGDVNDVADVKRLLTGQRFDVVVNWIAFSPTDIERDLSLFEDITEQYIFISSASCYQKPPVHPVITESTPLYNPFWEYSQNKIACEDRLMRAYRESGFPITIVRPSLTYDTHLPIAVGGWGCYTLPDRIKRGVPIIVHGDGTSLWTVTHAEDFAKGFVGLMGHPQAIGNAFHITSDEFLTWNQIYTTIARAFGREPNLVHIPTNFINKVSPDVGAGLLGDKAHSTIFDNTKIKTLVPDYRATIPFHSGIRTTMNWFEADPDRRVIVDSINRTMDAIIQQYGHV